MDETVYYSQLIGGTVTNFVLDEDDYPTFTLMMPNNQEFTLELSRDPEGNGPGFGFIGEVE